MRRFASSELGSLDNFMFEEVASPIPKHREVRIKGKPPVKATGQAA
ncbi:hypothetical protein At15955_49930 (plasmid) [Agrobacterium tumefaciens]|nr:hypothetical protein X971_5027 [Agrobacterium tumefaciens LBA4213 (Ach5)]AKC10599.1 hypothetical protein Ach5_48320 [Agrobacterium tumefaciens]AYM19978.1 hypothetical protein At15955_49930 [Agrobacterium tumefaciens]AYM71281.1 hypothetical protein AtA6_50650 [Agrobacterium tumefaciens]